MTDDLIYVDGDLIYMDGDLIYVDGDLIYVDGDLIYVDGDLICLSLYLFYRRDYFWPWIFDLIKQSSIY
ncbi:MAG: hypothetical protein MUF15_22460 [Acidobacteria bacterium]|nr:hypothetical protein [Acidobacteriota bacterium]